MKQWKAKDPYHQLYCYFYLILQLTTGRLTDRLKFLGVSEDIILELENNETIPP